MMKTLRAMLGVKRITPVEVDNLLDVEQSRVYMNRAIKSGNAEIEMFEGKRFFRLTDAGRALLEAASHKEKAPPQRIINSVWSLAG